MSLMLCTHTGDVLIILRRCFLHQLQLIFTRLLPGKTSTGGTRPGESVLLSAVVADIKLVLNKFALSSKTTPHLQDSTQPRLFKEETPVRPVLLPVFDVPTR